MYAAMCEQADISNSDAQAIAEGQQGTVEAHWLLRSSATHAALSVLNASEVKA